MAPASPMTQRRLSVAGQAGQTAAFKASPKSSPNPPSQGFPKRPVEQIADRKINRFGEARLRSPGPPAPPPPPSAAALQQSSGLASASSQASKAPPPPPPPATNGFPSTNGQGRSPQQQQAPHPVGGEIDFLDMLEKEEADFAEQVRRQKSFLQKIFREKEELAQMCVTQSGKLTKLEGERMEWQRKIIETERERRNFQERLDQEQQAHRQSVKKFEKVKRDSDKILADSAGLILFTGFAATTIQTDFQEP